MLSNLRESIGRADNATQSAIRDHILRLPSDGTSLKQDAPLRGIRHNLGAMMHHSADPNAKTYYRRGDQTGDLSGLIAARALQAGGMTAAGVGLVELTHAMSNTFGGPADTAPPDTLYM